MNAVTARASLVCDDVEPLLSPCVDGELVDDDRAAVRAHVAGCEACRARLQGIERVKHAVAAAGRAIPVQMPPFLLDQIRADVRRESRRSVAGRAARIGVGVALLAAVTVGGWFALSALSASSPQRVRALTSGVVAAALERHRLDVPVDVASPDVTRVQEFLAARVGHDLRVPRLEPLGFGLQGGRVVDVDDTRGAQLVYTGGYGQRLSVVMLADPDGALAARVLHGGGPLSTTSDGLAVRVQAGDGALVTIVGDLDDARIDRVARVVSAAGVR